MNTPSIWKPSATLKASFAVHSAAALGMVLEPATWPWAVGALVSNHALLATAGLLPRAKLLGPNLTHLPQAAIDRRQIALTIDDGPDPEVTPRVLDLLDSAGAKATFFCIGWRARKHPQIVREIAARGHRVENHGYSHSKAFATFGPRRMRLDITAAQETLADLTGRAPRFFRATAGLRNPFLDPVLNRLGLRLAAWTRRPYDTRCREADTVLARLTRGLGPGDILLQHDGNAARSIDGQPVILVVLPRLLCMLAERQLVSVTLDEACP